VLFKLKIIFTILKVILENRIQYEFIYLWKIQDIKDEILQLTS